MNIHLIEKKLNLLPENLKKEVLDFIDFLIAKGKQRKITGHFDFSWEGGLADLKNRYSSVGLQHKSMD